MNPSISRSLNVNKEEHDGGSSLDECRDDPISPRHFTTGAMINPSRIGLLPETTCCGIPTFPFRLHDMLNDAENEKFDHIVSWQGPQEFKIHDRPMFENYVLAKYFQIRFKSFQRQLSMYGFHRSNSGLGNSTYSHEFLVRGKPKMCHFMARIKVKSRSILPLVEPTPLPSYPAIPLPARAISPSPSSVSTDTTYLFSTHDQVNSTTVDEYESIMTTLAKNDLKLREVNQKLLSLRASSNSQCCSNGGTIYSSGWSANKIEDAPCSRDSRLVNISFEKELVPVPSSLIDFYMHGDVEMNDGLEFLEPIDPFETSLEPDFANDIIRILEL